MTKLRNVLAVAALIVVFASLAQAQCGCCCGLTPGYWKNHPEAWTAYSPDDPLNSVFSNVPADLAGDSLMDALNYQGGPGELGAAKILLRAAVASLLNASQLTTFCLTPQALIDWVNLALQIYNRACMLEVYTQLDIWNQDCVTDSIS